MYHVLIKEYHNVDWDSYVTQLELILDGELDYAKIKGENGFLVYPAGHVYHFYLIYTITNKGNVIIARFIYLFLYLLMNFFVFQIYDEVLPEKLHWIKIFLAISQPMLGIVADRLFNDIFSMIYMYACINFLLKCRKNSFLVATLLYSIAVSAKINVLLFLPGILYIFVKSKGVLFMISQLIFIISFQILVGLPFILHNPGNYFNKSFDLSRQFEFLQTMNWQMLLENIFNSPIFHKVLLLFHVSLLLMFLLLKWEKPANLREFIRKMRLDELDFDGEMRPLDKNFMVRVLFICNLIGILCCRSLHYQFLLWYYSSLPFLVWQTKLPIYVKFIMMLSFTYGWSYQRSPYKSLFLFIFHVSLLFLLAFYDRKGEKNQNILENQELTKKDHNR